MASPRPTPQRKTGLRLHRPIAVIDLETTGTSVQQDRIVEVGILKIMPDGEMLRLRKRVKPGIRIPREAINVHGIRNEDVADKPRFKSIARKVKRFIDGCDLAGFNLKTFDLPMLREEFVRVGIAFAYEDRHVIDVKEVYHSYETRTLADAVRFYCHSEHDEAHSALKDACATWRVLEAQIARYALPQSVRKLADFLEGARLSKYLDSGRWLTTRDGEPALAKGKYNGVLLSKMASKDSEYLEWILRLSDVPADTKQVIRKKLED